MTITSQDRTRSGERRSALASSGTLGNRRLHPFRDRAPPGHNPESYPVGAGGPHVLQRVLCNGPVYGLVHDDGDINNMGRQSIGKTFVLAYNAVKVQCFGRKEMFKVEILLFQYCFNFFTKIFGI